MHHVLEVPELFDIILKLANDTKDLLSCALLSHELSPRALDILWERQRSLVPVIRVIEGVEEKIWFCTVADGKEYSIKSPNVRLSNRDHVNLVLTLPQWKCLERYVHRMKTLVVTKRDYGGKLCRSVAITALVKAHKDHGASSSGSDFLFPNLRELRWTPHRAMAQQWPCVMGRSLTSLTIFCCDHTGERGCIAPVMELPIFSIPSLCPSLQYLEIAGFCPAVGEWEGQGEWVAALVKNDKLNTFIVEILRADSIILLPKFHALSTLNVFLREGQQSFQPPLVFRTLQDLKITANRLPDVVGFLAALDAPPLVVFHLKASECPQMDWQTQIRCLPECVQGSGHLRDLQLYGASVRSVSGTIDILPSINFPSLESLTLSFRESIHLTLDVIRSFTERHPFLVTLDLRPHSHTRHRARASPNPLHPSCQALTHFAKNCPRLTTLGVELDCSPNLAQAGLDTFGSASQDIVSHPLRRLWLGNSSRPSDVVSFQQLVLILFPKLARIEQGRSYSSLQSIHDAWADIQQLLRL